MAAAAVVLKIIQGPVTSLKSARTELNVCLKRKRLASARQLNPLGTGVQGWELQILTFLSVSI